MEDDSIGEEGASPSQQALDQQQVIQAHEAQAEFRGQVSFAAGEVLVRQQAGGDLEEARSVLGQLDALVQGGGNEAAAAEAYAAYRRYVQKGSAPAQPAAPKVGAKPAASGTQPPRPPTAVSKRADDAALLDPTTPIKKINEIRNRQKAARG